MGDSSLLELFIIQACNFELGSPVEVIRKKVFRVSDYSEYVFQKSIDNLIEKGYLEKQHGIYKLTDTGKKRKEKISYPVQGYLF